MKSEETGRVVRSTGSWYQLDVEGRSDLITCRLVGKVRQDDLRTTNPVAVGDYVSIVLKDNEWVIQKVLPRRNYIARQSPRKKHEVHLLASNVDQAIIVVTIVEPDLKLGFIDRFLLMTEPRDIPAVLVFNKADLYDDQAIQIYLHTKEVYEQIGYTCLLVSATSGLGLDALKTLMIGKTSLIAGQSGVGKSTLVNALEPGLELRTGEISDYSGKGQHTTTFAELHHLTFGADIIDTPGIKTLSFNNMELLDVVHNFREFFERSSDCRFANCTHRNEPGCAIKDALEAGELSIERYSSYLQILEEVEDQNYWERHQM
jgi:ribosome biogenesis GTPase / thiamine phosphate phosphatase